MAKKNKLAGLIAMVIGIVVSLGIGGLFVAGGFMDVVILKLLPLIVHQVVGWIIIGGTILGTLLGLLGK